MCFKLKSKIGECSPITIASSYAVNNDGIDGRPLLYFGNTSFDFGGDATDTNLDNLIYYNTPLP